MDLFVACVVCVAVLCFLLFLLLLMFVDGLRQCAQILRKVFHVIRADGWVGGVFLRVYGWVGGVFLSDCGHFNENDKKNNARGKVGGFPVA